MGFSDTTGRTSDFCAFGHRSEIAHLKSFGPSRPVFVITLSREFRSTGTTGLFERQALLVLPQHRCSDQNRYIHAPTVSTQGRCEAIQDGRVLSKTDRAAFCLLLSERPSRLLNTMRVLAPGRISTFLFAGVSLR